MRPSKPEQASFWLKKTIPFFLAGVVILLVIITLFFLLFLPDEPFSQTLKEHSYGLLIFTGLVISGLVAGILSLWLGIKKTHQTLLETKEECSREMEKLMTTEQEKQNLEKALMQGQKLQAIGTLAGGIAHDFNNLLYAIKGYVDMAREDLDKSTIIHRNLGKVLEAADRGRELVSRILAFSRRQHLDYKPIQLQSTLENALALLKPTIPASVNLIVETFSDDVIITGNQTQLHQVIVNIVNNAVDAMDGEGTITFRVTQVSPSDELLKKIAQPASSPYCKIEISDTGFGMDPQTMERIFEPFYTTKEVGKGTGLGLSTVYSIINNHQGLITVKSQLGMGSTFIILLPMLTVPAYDDMER